MSEHIRMMGKAVWTSSGAKGCNSSSPMEAGEQLWRWRAQMAVAQKLPSFIGRHYVTYLDRRKMKITPEVIDRLKSINAIERLENLKNVVLGNLSEPKIEKIEVFAAYKDLLADTEVKMKSVGEQYRFYQTQVTKRNESNLRRFNADADQVVEKSPTEESPNPSSETPSRPAADTKVIGPSRGNG